ncbi:Leucine-rich repeat serine/threonine-protein kinase 2 [Phytophthora pseudosyringae]|uniref:Leucine-rich repeat serine/threonine-protein kinase 2 n=1 Tax=Phytophthora pseudosyringae TaxID=221518 RepID=A0A8T1WGX9_9STRA|nr:Leucine-rich repeat serine/threonine-protein kinase 2 [Phytophthora pseudosyringae]
MGGKDNEPNADGVFTPRADYLSPAGPTQHHKRQNLIWGGVSLFLLLNVVALYILHFVDRGSKGDSVTSTISASTLSSANANSASEGQAVSYAANGQLTAGAGTTAYLSAASLPSEDQYMAYIKFAPLGTSETAYASNLMSYQTGSSPDTSCTVTVATADADAKSVRIADADSSNVFSGSTVKGLTTLSDSLAVALTTVTSSDGYTTTTYVTPVQISDGAVSVQQDQTVQAYNTSSSSFMTRVSDTSFALVYYESYLVSPYYQRVLVGSVADDGAISFSDSLEFGNANGATSTQFGTPQSVFNSSNTVTVPWYVEAATTSSNDTASSSVGDVGLCLFTASLSDSTLTKTVEVCDATVSPAYYIDSAKISETVIALSYFDTANNYALTVSLVEFSTITGSPTFRSSYVLDESVGAIDFGSAFGFYPTPIVRVLANDRLAVGFLNPANSGKPSIKVLSYSSDLTLSEESPVLPVANADFSLASADPKAAGSIVLDVVATETGAIVGYAGLWAGVQSQRVALVESFGKPVGVVSNVDGSALDVALSGTVDVSSGSLVKGTTYYASTEGTLYAASTTSTDDYVLANDNSVVISKDALVGVAVSSNKLVVTV